MFKLSFRMRLSFCLIVLMFDCKKDNNSEKNNIIPQKDNFVINIKAKMLEDDVIEFFYKEEMEIEFNEERKIKKNIIGSEKVQSIEFILNPKVFPFEFRIDLGQNKKQKDITIEKIILTHKNDSLIVEKKFLSTFFVVNKYLSLDSKNGIFKINELKGKRDPFIISKALLIKKMQIEL